MPERVALLLDDLLGGGAARVAAHLAGAWAEQGREVTVFTTDDGSVAPLYQLSSAVAHRPLALRGDSRSAGEAAVHNALRVLRLRRALRASRPELLISFLDTNNILGLLATRGMARMPTIISERSDPFGRTLTPGWERLRRWTYPWAGCLVTQSAHAMGYFAPGIRAKGRVIPNPVVPLPCLGPASPPAGPRRQVVTVGRLHQVKGHDLLIDAFAAVAGLCPDWDLVIHGEGSERPALEARIRALGLGSRITLPGASDQVGARLREASLFVLPSRVEGFPNALAEAMASGLPVISFACPSGPAELIRDGVDGVLVPAGAVPGLAGAMARLMQAPDERASLAARAPEVLTRFSLERILGLWEEAIQQVRRDPGGRP
jgi:glycosyltransferase involved in cell wall biosynthesis